MPFGIFNQTNITMQNITEIGNVTSLPDFFINVNHYIFADALFFIILFVLGAILFIISQRVSDQPMNNLMYVCAILSVIGLLARAITKTTDSGTILLLTDHQFWIFPLLTLILALIIWSTRE